MPFGLSLDCLRAAVVEYQESKLVDDIHEAIASRRLRIDSEPGQRLLQQLLNEAGIKLPSAPGVAHSD